MIKDLKELERLFKLCRKQGVLEFSAAGVVTIKFDSTMPMVRAAAEEVKDETAELSPDELIFYSARDQS